MVLPSKRKAWRKNDWLIYQVLISRGTLSQQIYPLFGCLPVEGFPLEAFSASNNQAILAIHFWHGYHIPLFSLLFFPRPTIIFQIPPLCGHHNDRSSLHLYLSDNSIIGFKEKEKNCIIYLTYSLYLPI